MVSDFEKGTGSNNTSERSPSVLRRIGVNVLAAIGGGVVGEGGAIAGGILFGGNVPGVIVTGIGTGYFAFKAIKKSLVQRIR